MHIPCHILYVSPNEADYRFTVQVLESDRNVSVDHLAAGHAVVGHLKARPERDRSNLIVLGSRVPDMTALELVRQLKADLELRTIPVLVVLPDMPQEAVDTLYDAGAACVVRRPESMDHLAALIRAMKAFWVDQAILPFCGNQW